MLPLAGLAVVPGSEHSRSVTLQPYAGPGAGRSVVSSSKGSTFPRPPQYSRIRPCRARTSTAERAQARFGSMGALRPLGPVCPFRAKEGARPLPCFAAKQGAQRGQSERLTPSSSRDYAGLRRGRPRGRADRRRRWWRFARPRRPPGPDLHSSSCEHRSSESRGCSRRVRLRREGAAACSH
jgi:hypothetical protein